MPLGREGFSKIFQQPLSAKAAAENAKRNISLTSALAPVATTEAHIPMRGFIDTHRATSAMLDHHVGARATVCNAHALVKSKLFGVAACWYQHPDARRCRQSAQLF